MDPIIITIIAAIAALILGVVGGKVLFSKNSNNLIQEAELKSNALISEAEQKAKLLLDESRAKSETFKEKKMLESKEHFLQLKTEHEQQALLRSQKLVDGENRIKQKEKTLNDKGQEVNKQLAEYTTKKESLDRQLEVVAKKQQELNKQHEEHIQRLEKISNLKAEDAKKELVEAIKNEAKTDAMAHVQEIMEEAKLTASKEAKKI